MTNERPLGIFGRLTAACRGRAVARRRLTLLVVAFGVLVLPQPSQAHGDLHLRIVDLTRRIEAATNNPARLYLERGELEREHADWDAAHADYDRAARLDPALPGLDLCRAKLLADSSRLDAARALLDSALRRNPTDGECFICRAQVLIKLDQRQLALADFRSGLDLLREPPPGYFTEFAQALVAGDRLPDALGVLDEGIRKHGPVLSLQGYAVDLEIERANTNAALARLDTIIAHAVRKETWLARRGDLLLGTGKFPEARAAFEGARAAIGRLPPLLQRSPTMVKLREHIEAGVGASQARHGFNQGL